MSSAPTTESIDRPGIITLPGWRIAGRGDVLDDCCLVIATYNRSTELFRLLDNLRRMPDPPGEVVVIDGSQASGISPRLWSWVDSELPPFDLCYAQSAPGLTRQRNAGVDISTRPFVFFLDDDAVPIHGYFAEMRRVLTEDRAKRIGALAGCVINEMNKPIPRRWRLRFALGIVPRIEPMKYYPSGTHTPRGLLKPFSGIRKVDVMPGCAWTFRREVFEKERFSSFFEGYSQGEDLEMSLRVGRNWEIFCCGDARILHLPAPGGRPVSFRRGWMEMRNRHFIWKRHSPRPGLEFVLRFWMDTAFLVVMDLLWYCARPWRFEPLGHACGTLAGIARCLAMPYRFDEPKPRTEYRLEGDWPLQWRNS